MKYKLSIEQVSLKCFASMLRKLKRGEVSAEAQAEIDKEQAYRTAGDKLGEIA